MTCPCYMFHVASPNGCYSGLVRCLRTRELQAMVVAALHLSCIWVCSCVFFPQSWYEVLSASPVVELNWVQGTQKHVELATYFLHLVKQVSEQSSFKPIPSRFNGLRFRMTCDIRTTVVAPCFEMAHWNLRRVVGLGKSKNGKRNVYQIFHFSREKEQPLF